MALQLVEQMTKVVMRPYTTLRQYLASLGPRSGPALTELTFLTERTLYSRYATGEQEAARAEEMLHLAAEEARGETI